MKNIHVLPTDKPSRVFITKDEGLGFDNQMLENTELDCQNQNIYITNDEIVTEYSTGLYFIDVYTGRNDVFSPIKIDKDSIHAAPFHSYMNNGNMCKRIILTTDPQLIKNGVQAIDDEFLEWFVKNPSCEEVEVAKTNKLIDNYADKDEDKWDVKYHIYLPTEESKQECMITKIMQMDAKMAYDSLPKQEILLEDVFNEEKKKGVKELIDKQKTLEEGYNKIYKEIDFSEFDFASFAIGVKHQQERSYSEEEVIAFGEFIFKHSLLTHTRGVKSLFEQFKNK